MDEERCFKIVQRWAYFNSAMLGLCVGYILARWAGALIGMIVAIAVNYGLMASARFTVKMAGEAYKAVEKGIKDK